jgi:hypothetical protein
MIGDISSRSVDDRLRADTINNIQQRGTIKKRIAANGRESYKLHFATCVSFVPEPIRYSWQVVGIVSRAVLVVRAVVYQLNIESSFCCTAVVVEPDSITMSFAFLMVNGPTITTTTTTTTVYKYSLNIT